MVFAQTMMLIEGFYFNRFCHSEEIQQENQVSGEKKKNTSSALAVHQVPFMNTLNNLDPDVLPGIRLADREMVELH